MEEAEEGVRHSKCKIHDDIFLLQAAQKPKGSPKDEETDKRSKVKEERLAKEQQERFEKLKEWKVMMMMVVVHYILVRLCVDSSVGQRA